MSDQVLYRNLAQNPGGGHSRKMWVGGCGALVEALNLLRPKYKLFFPTITPF